MPFKAPESYELDRSVSPSREPFDGTYRYSSDSEFSVVDEFDPLKTSDRPYKDDASQPLRSVFDTDKSATRPLAWLDTQRKRGNLQRWLIPSRFMCVLVLVVVATFVLLLSAGGIWVYHEAVPNDGESEPWYPSPRGGSVKKWQESYKKASKLVDQMTLVEKVNITTGVPMLCSLQFCDIKYSRNCRDGMVYGYVCGQHWACRQTWIPQSMSTGWTIGHEIRGQWDRVPRGCYSGRDVEQGPHVRARQGTRL
jgi:hypothetical protein